MKPKTHHWLPLILAAAVLLRLGAAFYLGNEVDAPPLLTDQRSYHALGQRLLAGHGYSFADNWYPFTPANSPTAHWSFLYPLFVAGVYSLTGPQPLAARLVQAVLAGILLPLLVYHLARRFTPLSHQFSPLSREAGEGGRGGEGLPRLAAAIAALYGYYVLYAATLMTESFFIITLLWSLLAALQLGDRWRAGRPASLSLIIQLGLSLGLAALLRQSILPWAPALFLWLLGQAWRGGRLGPAFRRLAPAGLILLVFILPWSYRNYQSYGQFLLLNSNAGYAMYSGQHPMHGTTFQEFAAAPLPEGAWGQTEAALDRALMAQGLEFIVAEPGRYLRLCLSRARAFFEFWPTADTSLLHNLGRSGSFGLLLPFILYGLWLALRDRSFLRQNSLLLLFAAVYTLLHLLTWAMVRYRLPVDAVLIPFAALALVDLYARARQWLVVRRRAAVST